MKSVVWLLCSLLVLPAFAQTTESLVYRYAYTSNIAGTPDYQLHLIDPHNPANEQIIPLPTLTFTCGDPSPDGRWLVLCYHDPTTSSYRGLMLLEIATGSIRQVKTILVNYEMMPQDRPQWSPDSRYLAFWDYTPGGSGTYIYVLETNAILPIIIPNDTGLADEIVGEPLFQMWSPDSTRFVVSICLHSYCSTKHLMTLSVPELKVTAFTEFESYASDLCHQAWSPDGRYISFQLYCASLFGGTFQEIYLWDTQQNQLEQLTHFTETAREEWTANYPPERYANFNMFWFDAQTLLAGVSVAGIADGGGVDIDTFVSETWAYHLPSDSALLTSNHASEWTPRPLSNQIALRADAFMIDDRRELQTTQSNIQIATFDGEQLTIQYTLPTGCNLSWSPDGRVLAYENGNTVETCYTQQEGFTLWTAENSQSTAYRFPTAILYPQIVGWVAVPDSWVLPMPYYEIGTPTPFPTSSGAG